MKRTRVPFSGWPLGSKTVFTLPKDIPNSRKNAHVKKKEDLSCTVNGKPVAFKQDFLTNRIQLFRSYTSYTSAAGLCASSIFLNCFSAVSHVLVDPIQNVVQVLEKQYLEEKRSALEEQRLRYERELDLLRQQLSPERSSQQHQRSNSDRLTFPTHTTHSKMRLWTEERSTHTHASPNLLYVSHYIHVFVCVFCVCFRDELFRQSLSRLREQVVRANTLVREANFLSEEIGKLTDYQVTLQIPAAHLSVNRKVRTRMYACVGCNSFKIITKD